MKTMKAKKSGIKTVMKSGMKKKQSMKNEMKAKRVREIATEKRAECAVLFDEKEKTMTKQIERETGKEPKSDDAMKPSEETGPVQETTVRAQFLAGTSVVLGNFTTVGSVMAHIARIHGRFAAEVVVMSPAGEVLQCDSPPLPIVSVILLPQNGLDARAAMSSLVLHSEDGDVATCERLLELEATLACVGDAMIAAVRANNVGALEVLLEAGACVDAEGSHETLGGEGGCTALMTASWQGNTEIVRMLLATAANANSASNRGLTPLHRASDEGHEKIVRMLLVAGARVNSASNSGLSPLHEASGEGHEEIVRLLLVAAANTNSVCSHFGTPLNWASLRGHEEIVRVLLAARANANAISDYFGAPLHWASLQGDDEIVRMLLAADANANSISSPMGTPLYWASVQGYEEIVQMLLAAGATANSICNGAIEPL